MTRRILGCRARAATWRKRQQDEQQCAQVISGRPNNVFGLIGLVWQSCLAYQEEEGADQDEALRTLRIANAVADGDVVDDDGLGGGRGASASAWRRSATNVRGGGEVWQGVAGLCLVLRLWGLHAGHPFISPAWPPVL